VYPTPKIFFFGAIEEKDETQKILALFQVAEELSISDVMKALQLSRPTAGRRLAELTQKHLLTQIGQGKGTRYRKKEQSS
jgi:predicted HTH transcriptional regulator